MKIVNFFIKSKEITIINYNIINEYTSLVKYVIVIKENINAYYIISI